MPRPVIALLTDFGLGDHYVGAMKGVMLGICPDATLVDISHGVPAHDVMAGALELAAAYRYFPDRTVFLVVIDPGVGSARRGLAAAVGSHRFVAPDNGVLAAVFDETPPSSIVELADPRYMRAEVSRTFEGRDRFAPAAAWLATGLDLASLGPGVPADSARRLSLPQPRLTPDGIAGEVVWVDHFGNLITNIDRGALDAFQAASSQSSLPGSASPSLTVAVGSVRVSKLLSTYSEAAPGELCALVDSSNHLEIAANGASAAAALGVGRGAPVLISAARGNA